MPNIPDLPHGFSTQLLTTILHEEGSLPPGGEVADLTLEEIGDGTGLSSDLARLKLSYRGERGQAPDSVIAKFLPQNELNRTSAIAFNLPEREVRFAEELDPQTEAVTPRTYCRWHEGERFLLIMEDLGDYEVGSQVIGADLPQTELAIDELAKLHSAFWNKVDDLDWVPGVADSYHADAMFGGAQVGWDGMLAQFEVPDTVNQYRDRFLAAIPALQAERMRAPNTLVHGDFRMENLLYGCQPEHHPIVVIDWQGPLKARGILDVALFLGQSTTTEVRRDHEEALLARYLEGLKARGVDQVDMAALWEDYQRCVLYNWVYTAVVAGTLDTSNEIAARWIAKMVQRQVAISEDLDVFRFLPA